MKGKTNLKLPSTEASARFNFLSSFMPNPKPEQSPSDLTPSMQRLHAYWRMPYILAPKNPDEGGNPFTRITQSGDDQKEYILYRGRLNYIVLNRFPYNAGHLLVIPFREVPTLDQLTAEERHELMDLIVKAQTILTHALAPEGFNTGFNFGSAGGAGIPSHLHCHVVPRWSGDTNFMPVIGNTRVIPEAMDAMWKRLNEFVNV
jgi:ATP adenylyltransferase